MSSAAKPQKFSLKKASILKMVQLRRFPCAAPLFADWMFAPGLVQGHELRIEVKEDRILHVKVQNCTQPFFDSCQSLMRPA